MVFIEHEAEGRGSLLTVSTNHMLQIFDLVDEFSRLEPMPDAILKVGEMKPAKRELFYVSQNSSTPTFTILGTLFVGSVFIDHLASFSKHPNLRSWAREAAFAGTIS